VDRTALNQLSKDALIALLLSQEARIPSWSAVSG